MALIRRSPLREELAYRAPDHQRDQLLRGERLRCARAHDFPVAQHHDVVAEVEDIRERVRDVNHGDAARAHPADEREESIRFALAQRRGRFIKQNEPGVDAQRLGDLDQLSFAGGKRFDQTVRRDLQAHLA